MTAQPRVHCISNFLSAAECESIRRELEFTFWSPSLVLAYGATEGHFALTRISESTDESWFSSTLARYIRHIDKCLGHFVPGFSDRREQWQAIRYRAGGIFEPHLDCIPWSNDPQGDREYTAVICLNTPRWGGSVHFPVLNFTAKARAGRLLWWPNLTDQGTPNTDMMHASLPVKAGSKTVLVSWARERAI